MNYLVVNFKYEVGARIYLAPKDFTETAYSLFG